MPKFDQSVLPAEKGDTIEADEVWTYVGSKTHRVWIWLSWSFFTTQTLSFAVGSRDAVTGKLMFEGLPASYQHKQVYTDGYGAYDSLIPWSRHWVCPKGTGDTNVAEGCNNYLRHRISYLVRKSSSFARKSEWLYRRLFLVLFTRNMRLKQTADTQQGK